MARQAHDSTVPVGIELSWPALAAAVLEREPADVEEQAATASFTALGGTSLRAIEFAALLARHHGRAPNLGTLLGTRALADVLVEAAPAPLPIAAEVRPTGLRSTARVQQAMLLSEQLYGGSAFHLLFSVDIEGPLDVARLRSALAHVTRRHAALRTVFTLDDDGSLRQRVVARWDPVVLEQRLPDVDGDPVAAVHAQLQQGSGAFLRPYERPPVVFVLSRVDPQRAVLSLLIHHAIADGWSIGVLLRELATAYAGGSTVDGAAAPHMAALIAAESAETVTRAAELRAAALADLPSVVTLPTDLERPQRLTRGAARLVFALSDGAGQACLSLARTGQVTRNMVLLAAWSLVVARRCATDDLVMGMVSAGRPTAESLGVVGACMKVLPVGCRVTDTGTVREYLHATAGAVREALDAAQVPCEAIVSALGIGGDDSRNPLVQMVFAAHDELVPEVLQAGDLTMTVHEGHCGGSVYDAVLYVQRWGGHPRLALEYNTSVLRADEAAELTCALDQTLVEMAGSPDGPLADVRTMTSAQRQRLHDLADGPEARSEAGLWQLFEAAARRHPDRIAVRDGDPSRVLTYRELLHAAEAQSAALAAAGVVAGDCVGLAVGRSAQEIVAILAVLRLGAAYTGVEPEIPGHLLAGMLDSVGTGVVVCDDDRLATVSRLGLGRTTVRVRDPWAPGGNGRRVPDAADADPNRVAYVAFTSGSTGTAKGIRVPHRGVVRLAWQPRYLRPGACERFLRLAPLAFDASTLEVFAPLIGGGTVEVFADPYLTPDALAQFVRSREVTGMWLTAGLFRLVADYRPDAFRHVLQVLTGGDTVPTAQVVRVLRECPGLRITNGYGPTENTTFTTVHHVDDAAAVEEPLPIGTPIQGTGVFVLDSRGRVVPPGGTGELCTYGAGLALGYADLPAQTQRAFGRFSADLDQRLYRTGDLVRWDAAGRLRFLGRVDRQIKIRGYRIEMDLVARTLRECPGVRDAAVAAVGSVAADRRLLAGLVADPDPATVERVRDFAAARLPGYSVPSLWAVVAELPVTRNGKLDVARLRELATRPDSAAPVPNTTPAPNGGAEAPDPITRTIAGVWRDVLGTDRFGTDDCFFDVGGDSLQLLRVAAGLRRDLPRLDVTVQDLFACKTIRALATRLEARTGRGPA